MAAAAIVMLTSTCLAALMRTNSARLAVGAVFFPALLVLLRQREAHRVVQWAVGLAIGAMLAGLGLALFL